MKKITNDDNKKKGPTLGLINPPDFFVKLFTINKEFWSLKNRVEIIVIKKTEKRVLFENNNQKFFLWFFKFIK